jgi:hypothetical protein
MGRRGLRFVLVVAAMGWTAAAGQTAADGSLQGNVYSNRYFKISLTLPQNLHPIDVASLNVHGPARDHESLMLAARDGNDSSGMILLAEKLNVGSSPIADGQDFLRKVRKSWDDGEVLDGQQVRTQKYGLTFEELDYEIPKVEFDSAIVTRVGDYLLAFRCNAKSKEELKGMVDAVMAMRHG